MAAVEALTALESTVGNHQESAGESETGIAPTGPNPQLVTLGQGSNGRSARLVEADLRPASPRLRIQLPADVVEELGCDEVEVTVVLLRNQRAGLRVKHQPPEPYS